MSEDSYEPVPQSGEKPEAKKPKSSKKNGKRKAAISKKRRSASLARREFKGGRPRIPAENRCPCGKYSKPLALRRGHRCTAPVDDSLDDQANDQANSVETS